MKALIIGNGAREHALAWTIARSPATKKVYVAPGNAGTFLEEKCENVDIDPLDFPALIKFAKEKDTIFTLVGPEIPLAAGIVDAFTDAGLNCFGPTKAAAQLESSKTFSKEFMKRHNIPTADYATFTDARTAKNWVREHETPIVIKADGLAAGKGVIIAQNHGEAFTAIDNMLTAEKFGQAGQKIIIEEFLEGEEVSYMVVSDGWNALPLPTTQDHKTRDNGDKGPNTGGMGAYSPAPIVTPEMEDKILNTIIMPTIRGMGMEHNSYEGFLYAGLMITNDGTPKVLEFNCRLGDPETQVLMMRLKHGFLDIIFSTFNKELDDDISVKWDRRPALNVVLTAGGYPDSYQKSDEITGLPTDTLPDAKVFHAGTTMKDGKIVTNGGRVLSVTVLGNTLAKAKKNAYALAEQIHWKDIYYRTDIGDRAL